LKLIVGLGNPGEKYESTRHNVGFDVIGLFRREIIIKSGERYQHHSLVIDGQLGNNDLVLAKPQTFMNASGKAVSALALFYGVPMDDVYVIYDDLNLSLGILRIRRGGSSGGHKGIKSIIDSLGDQNFPRLRIGIGNPPEGMDTMDYVLGEFSKEEREDIDRIESIAVDALKTIIIDGIDSAMNKYNNRQKDDSVLI